MNWTRTAMAVFALCVGIPSPTLASDSISTVAPQPDPRIGRLNGFFKSFHCPAPYHASEYVRAADRYGLDYRLLPAVSIRETLCGKAERHPNNPWGFHQESFPSIAAGIDFLARRLTQHPYYKGKTILEKLFTYNPKPAYPGEIDRIMRKIE
jgi:hypothetical protein